MSDIPPRRSHYDQHAPTPIVRWLPLQGVCTSRHAAAELLRAGKVTINDCTINELGTLVIPGHDVVLVDGVKVIHNNTQQHSFIMMNKAPNTLCTRNNVRQCRDGTREVDTRKTVYDTIPHHNVQCVGRLDKDTTGILILTSDGLLNHVLVQDHVPKVYQCTLRTEGPLSDRAIHTIQNGIILPNSKKVFGKAWNQNGIVCIEISNGYFHQVKHMLQHVKRPLALLHRSRFAGLELDKSLEEGTWRYLTNEEVEALFSICSSSSCSKQ